MCYRWLIFLFFLFISCEKNETDVIISGKVTDDATGLPVEGAAVTLTIHYSCDGRTYNHYISGASAMSDQDGFYSMNYKYNNNHPPVFPDGCNLNIKKPFPFPDRYSVYAGKPGYITTDYHYLNDNIFQNADIKLYRSAQLSLHVRNEGINKVESVRVCLDRGLGYSFFGTPQYIYRCIGNDFDTIYKIRELWGGFTYICKVIPLNGPTHVPIPYVNKSILLLPDTNNDVLISY